MNSNKLAHASTQVLGLMLMAAALIFGVVVLLVLGETEELLFFGPIAAVVAVVALVVSRFDKTWAKVLGLVVALGAFGTTFFLAFGVFQIFSPLEFILGLLLLIGFLIALIWGIMALIAGVRGRTASDGERRLRKWVLNGVGALILISVVGFFFTRGTVDEAEAAGATRLDMVDFEFEPESVTVGTEGKLLVHNSDPFSHDITIEDLDVYVHIGPGSESLVDVSGAAPGRYDYFCSLHTDPETKDGMTGTFTIEG